MARSPMKRTIGQLRQLLSLAEPEFARVRTPRSQVLKFAQLQHEPSIETSTATASSASELTTIASRDSNQLFEDIA